MNYLSFGLLWFLSMSLTLLFLLLWFPSRAYLMPNAAKARQIRMAHKKGAKPKNVRNGQTAEKGIVEAPFAKSVPYYLVGQWSQQALRSGLNHDFNMLGREEVHLHYHKANADCVEKCETVRNPNLIEKEGNNEQVH